MNQHRCFEIALSEHAGYVAKVRLNLVDRSRIGSFVRGHLNGASILQKVEMVGGLGMGESHNVIAPCVHSGVVVLRDSEHARRQ